MTRTTDRMTATDVEASVHSEAHRLLRLDPTLDWDGAVARACSENPELYRAYDTARAREADADLPPHPDKPEPVGVAGTVKANEMLGEMVRKADECGRTFEDYVSNTTHGREAYARYDEAVKRPSAPRRKS